VAEYAEVEKARDLPGLRLVLSAGVPGPWGEAAKALFHVKRIPYTRVRQTAGAANEALRAWTGHDNAPQAVLGDEPARTSFSALIFLAERLAPEPGLVPAEPHERALMFGLIHELAGEHGLGWCRRLMMFDRTLSLPTSVLAADHPARLQVEGLGRKYGYSRAAAQAAPGRVASILRLLSQQLADQHEEERRYLIGGALSALDLYWAAFAAMVSPLPEAQCPMPAVIRPMYELAEPERGHCSPELLAHRDFVYSEHLELPVDL
jgi:glutathione S-transferase